MTSSLTEKRHGWDYDGSVRRVRPMVLRWATLTVEMLGELWAARDALSSQGARTDLTSGQMSRSWDGYCTDVGLEKRTANRWLSQYDPERRCMKELPEPEPTPRPEPVEFRPERDPVVDRAQEPAARGSKRELSPEQKTKVAEFNERMRRQDEKAREEQAKDAPLSSEERADLLRRAREMQASLEEASARFARFSVAGAGDDMTQTTMMQVVERYVLSFNPPARRLEVAHNLIKSLRMLIHEINGEEVSA